MIKIVRKSKIQEPVQVNYTISDADEISHLIEWRLSPVKMGGYIKLS